ncbi:mycofactocin-coupled SDR family oxidoreductase [Amycolatopsis sp. NPDC004079]|uniref:mycofactocin-coupled SDR family oxidoreductase n=1 Tax=Amycolatopsis sp. NPDC004079 TaxID=3154549 RepID=UPI0033A45FAC
MPGESTSQPKTVAAQGLLADRVAFVTGAGRGQGRSHAVALAREGASVIAVDLARPIESVPYSLSTKADLDETARLVRELGREIVAEQADVRDRADLETAFRRGIEQFGGCDIVVANAGIAPVALDGGHPDVFRDVLDVNVTGVWHTVEAARECLLESRHGAVVVTGSTFSLSGVGGDSPGAIAYTASKHAVLGLMRSYANSLGPQGIRVNAVLPGGVDTVMVANPSTEEYYDRTGIGTRLGGPLPLGLADPGDVSHAVVWLASDLARYVTGAALPVDGGFLVG